MANGNGNVGHFLMEKWQEVGTFLGGLVTSIYVGRRVLLRNSDRSDDGVDKVVQAIRSEGAKARSDSQETRRLLHQHITKQSIQHERLTSALAEIGKSTSRLEHDVERLHERVRAGRSDPVGGG